MYTRIGSFDFAIKSKITPQKLMPDFGTIHRATLLNGESFAAKNVHFLSLVNLNSENLALKNQLSFDSPRYDCILFVSLIKFNSKDIRFEKRHTIFHQSNLPSSKATGLWPAFFVGLGWNDSLHTFLVTLR